MSKRKDDAHLRRVNLRVRPFDLPPGEADPCGTGAQPPRTEGRGLVRVQMIKKLTLVALSVTLTLGAVPASAGFFLEGLKPFTEEPRCPDPYATNKEGCEVPDSSYPTSETGSERPDTRTTTREGAPRK